MNDENRRSEAETATYLAKIRKTIADSQNLVSQVRLRIAETDRMLEKQGLTREQVMQMHFSEAQMEAVNAELKRRGLDPLEQWDEDARRESLDAAQVLRPEPEDLASGGELAERQKKFGMMMKPFHI